MKDSKFYKVMRPIIKFLFMIIFIPKRVNKEYIPKDGRIVLAGNHTGILDCILLGICTKRGIHFLAKKELWSGPKKLFFSNLGLIPVDRSIHDKDSLYTAYKYLESEKVIGIFPEGTTEKGKGLLPFKIGAVKMAHKTSTKIVPFVITGKYIPFFNKLTITFLDPMEVKSDNLEEENNKLRNRIKSVLGDDK